MEAAVITSYPKSSGLSNPRDSDNDGVIDAISRIHVFVTDTHAVSMGREGMSIQLVESDYNLLESYVRGDVITFDATLGFYNGTAQVGVENVILVGNVNDDLTQYASLLEPWEVPMSELNTNIPLSILPTRLPFLCPEFGFPIHYLDWGDTASSVALAYMRDMGYHNITSSELYTDILKPLTGGATSVEV